VGLLDGVSYETGRWRGARRDGGGGDGRGDEASRPTTGVGDDRLRGPAGALERKPHPPSGGPREGVNEWAGAAGCSDDLTALILVGK